MNVTPLKNCKNPEINVVLLRVYQMIGMLPANYPVDSLIFTNHLKRFYPDISLTFLSNAFEIYCRGTQFNVNIEFHGVFSIIFMDQVIQAYQRYVRAKQQASTEEEINPVPTPEERMEIMRAGIYHAMREYRTNHRIIDMAGTRWDWLVKNGYANFTDQRMEQFKTRALNDPESANIFTKLGSGEKKDIMMEIASKNLALKAFFDDLIETGTELETVLIQ